MKTLLKRVLTHLITAVLLITACAPATLPAPTLTPSPTVTPIPPPTITPDAKYTPLLQDEFFDPSIGARQIQNGDDIYMLTWDIVYIIVGDTRCNIGHYGGPREKIFLSPDVSQGGCTKERLIATAEKWQESAPEEQKPFIGKIIEEIRALQDWSGLTVFEPLSGDREKEADGQIFRISWQTDEFPQAEIKVKCLVGHYNGPKNGMMTEQDVFDGRCTKELVIEAAEKWQFTLPFDFALHVEELIAEIQALPDRNPVFIPIIGHVEKEIGAQNFAITWKNLHYLEPENKIVCSVSLYGNTINGLLFENNEPNGRCTKELVIETAERWKMSVPEEFAPYIDELIEAIRNLE